MTTGTRESKVWVVNCCQCGATATLRAGGKSGCLPPVGWLEIFVNPKAFPEGLQPSPLVVRVCPRCNVVDRACVVHDFGRSRRAGVGR